MFHSLVRHGIIFVLGLPLLFAGSLYSDSVTAKVFYAAILNNDLNTIKAYLAGGGDVNARDEAGQNALQTAASLGSTGIVALLLQNGADKNATNSWGQNALMLSAYSGHLESVELLLRSRAEVNTADKRSLTALMCAAKEGHPLTARALLRSGATVNFRNASGWTALMYAAQRNHPRTIRMLRAYGASTMGYTNAVLLGAAERGEPKRVKDMLRKGGDPNFKSDDQWTPLILAAMRDRDYTAAWIWDEKSERMIPYQTGKPPQKPSTGDYFQVIRTLIEAGANVNRRGWAGSFPLMYAFIPDAADLLIRCGADVNAQDDAGNTALLMAAMDDPSGDVVQRLLQAGARVNVSAKNGATPLHLAAMTGKYSVVKMLIASGADPHAKDANEKTPLMYAEENHNERLAQLLRDAQAKQQ